MYFRIRVNDHLDEKFTSLRSGHVFLPHFCSFCTRFVHFLADDECDLLTVINKYSQVEGDPEKLRKLDVLRAEKLNDEVEQVPAPVMPAFLLPCKFCSDVASAFREDSMKSPHKLVGVTPSTISLQPKISALPVRTTAKCLRARVLANGVLLVLVSALSRSSSMK